MRPFGCIFLAQDGWRTLSFSCGAWGGDEPGRIESATINEPADELKPTKDENGIEII
jgi:hypothetical protein